jgi:hypothetical protein
MISKNGLRKLMHFWRAAQSVLVSAELIGLKERSVSVEWGRNLKWPVITFIQVRSRPYPVLKDREQFSFPGVV